MAAEGESDKMPSDTEVHVKRKCGNGFLHTEKMSAIDIHRHLPNVYKDQTVGVNTVMQWVIAHLNSWYCSVKDKKKKKEKKKPCFGQPCTTAMLQNQKRLNQLIHTNW